MGATDLGIYRRCINRFIYRRFIHRRFWRRYGGNLAGSPQEELDLLTRGASRQVRPGELSGPGATPGGGRELRVSYLACNGGPHQVPRRSDLAPVRPFGRRVGGGGRDRRFLERRRRQPGTEHHPPLPRPGALPRLAGVRHLLSVLYPPAEGRRPGEDPDVAVRECFSISGGAYRDQGRHTFRWRPSTAERPASR